MTTQNEFNLSTWERFKKLQKNGDLFNEVEDLCRKAAGLSVEDIPDNKKVFAELNSMATNLPDEVRPVQSGPYALYMWAIVVSTRLRKH